eukprot:7654204-Alexandrium_andersonii.AAC.1
MAQTLRAGHAADFRLGLYAGGGLPLMAPKNICWVRAGPVETPLVLSEVQLGPMRVRVVHACSILESAPVSKNIRVCA